MSRVIYLSPLAHFGIFQSEFMFVYGCMCVLYLWNYGSRLQITYASCYIFPLYFSRIYCIQILTFNLYFHVCWLFLCLFHLFILSSGILEFFVWFWTYLPWCVSMILLFLCIYTYVTFLPWYTCFINHFFDTFLWLLKDYWNSTTPQLWLYILPSHSRKNSGKPVHECDVMRVKILIDFLKASNLQTWVV